MLIINCVVYAWQDWQTVRETLGGGASLFDWIDGFSTTLDDLAWLVLALIYEFETAWASDEGGPPRLQSVRHAAVVLCYAVILHTFYVYAQDLRGVYQVEPAASLASPCEIADQGQYFLYNQSYTPIDAGNCARLGSGAEFFRMSADSVTDVHGLITAMIQAWASVVESGLWIMIVSFLAIMTLMQERGIAEGVLFRTADTLNICCYAMIALISCYWAWMNWPIYLWDNFLWTAAFAAIEMNLVRWRREMRVEAAG